VQQCSAGGSSTASLPEHDNVDTHADGLRHGCSGDR
jgi:hypothetical protein